MTVTRFLKNPKTEDYNKLKELILGGDFPWFRLESTIVSPDFKCDEGHEDFPFLSHRALTRPDGQPPCLYSQVTSQYVDYMQQVFLEIAKSNDINPQVIYRINVNATYPTKNNLPSPLHIDHYFPHKNMIIYLTDTHGGCTIVDGKEYNSKEDDVIIFNGDLMHCAKPPSKDIRVVMVVTFL